MRGPPGSIASLETSINGAFGTADEYAAMVVKVHDTIQDIDPDMICVDCFSSPYAHGVRLTRRKYIVTVPCSPGLTAKRRAFAPQPIAANRDGSWKTFCENIVLQLHEFIHSHTNRKRLIKRQLLKKSFRLPSLGYSHDTWILPPYWKDVNCVAGIHFNTLGLADCPVQPSKLAFVGAGLCPDLSPPCSKNDEDLEWMDQALVAGDDVVYMNMGSMFIWNKKEFWECMDAFKNLRAKHGYSVRFLVKINRPSADVKDTSLNFELHDNCVPSFIRLTSWVRNQREIYSHPSLKVFIHHGGGNSFNEAVHFGVPQLVLSQWFDTHEYGYSAEQFGLGFRSRAPPAIERCDVEKKLLAMIGPQWPLLKSNCMAWAIRSEAGGGAGAAARIVLGHAQHSRTSPGSSTSSISIKRMPTKYNYYTRAATKT
jgi:hypothetical protein